ncbi:hypothetical protein OUZ56_032224 [Daphnia magna]|uniref:Uncharacterized protein n=1 Tax=Daphnia magna TaxID=35525 RepID=A0ABQ9ZWI7_9CRUS|nr:hypothetical protein OUZ56_032224 [Daphnia magna]
MSQQYNKFLSFKRHGNKVHGSSKSNHVESAVEVSNENAKVDIPVLQSEEATEEKIFVSEDSEGINTNAEVKIPFADLTEREWEAGVLLLLRQKHYLPFDALMCVSASMHDFYERRLLTIQDPPTKSKFKRKSVIGDAKITDSHQFQNVFNPIIQEEELTCSRLETTWSNVFPTVMPQSVVLNESDPSYDWKMDKELGLILHEVFEMSYTIPFIQSLKQFLEIKSVHDAVGNNFHNNTRVNSEVYSDVWDGKFVKRDPEFINLNGAILGFQIYMDEVELANPLGTSNFVAGFKEGVGFANLPCRSCMTHKDQLETIHREANCIMRDKISHQF